MIFVHFWLCVKEILELALELSKVYTNLARIWIGPRLIVFLTHPKDVEIILGSSVYIDKSDEYRFFKPWLGNGLLISNGEHWRSHRKLIAPAFHQNVLKSFIGTFNSNSLNVVQRMQKEVGSVFDCHDYMSETTVDILLGKIKVHDVNSIQLNLNLFVKHSFRFARQKRPWATSEWAKMMTVSSMPW